MIELTDSINLYTREDWGATDPRPMTWQGWDATEAFIHHSDDSRADVINTFEKQVAHMRFLQRLHMVTLHQWSDIGYHFVVFQPWGNIPYARIFQGRARGYVPAAQEGHNTGTLAVCVVGDFSRGEDELMRNTRYAIEVLLRRYMDLRTLGGHRDVVSTSCPGDNLYSQIPRIAGAIDLSVYKG